MRLNLSKHKLTRLLYFNQLGFIAATILLEDSEGNISNRDSLVGSALSYLEPGGVYWCNSGSGLIHEQIPVTSGPMLRGLQIFIDLPGEHKFSKPSVQLIRPKDVPKSVTPEGVTVRTLAGGDSPVVSLVDISILELTIPKGASFTYSPPPEYCSALIHMISGEVLVAETFLGPFDTASFTTSSANSMKITNIAENDEKSTAKLIIFAGCPLSQPAVWGGPFLMLSETQINDRKRAFQEGEMGFLSPSLVSWPKKN